ncbi:MAG: D-alanyl-D-alanine carboxypeptidase family protein, partial [Erysipelotrichales bacterium]|nr:D-alanyl-D-alanine carboxypeptidase family protein [Erysipelotrichales bacterium]
MTLADLPISISKGTLINGESVVTTSKLGKNEVILILENEYGFKCDHVYSYEVVDTTAPVLENVADITLQKGSTTDLWDGIVVSDNSEEEITTSIEGEYTLQTSGTYAITYVAVDASGNETREDVTLTVKEVYVPDLTHEYVWDDQEIITNNGYTLKIQDGIPSIDGIIIVNKTYSIPSTFGNGLTADTLTAFNTMRTEAAAEGLTLWNASGYRSYTYQKGLYNNYCARRGQSAADTFSARPGFSEHQLGMAIDLNTITQEFKNTAEGQWVANNCYKYGFIIRYPEGKDHITGYIYEPWHIRYVGVDLATILYNGGEWITLEEYYGIE